MSEPEYSPAQIEYWLKHWPELQSAGEGGSGSLGGNGAGRGNRMALVCMLADLERAADELPLYWRGTLEVFRLQGRARTWADRRLKLEDIPIERAISHMARTLGGPQFEQ